MLRRLLLLACIALPVPALAQPMPGGFADLVEKLSPAVVNISTTQKVKSAQGMFGMPFQGLPNTPEFEPFREFFERFGQMQGQPVEREAYSLGSGFIIDAQGHVITNNHVIDEAEEITVTLPDDAKYTARVVGRDAKTDLALLKVDSKKPLPFVTFGDSDAMRVGDLVIAIGNPFGLGGSVTQGIISARSRSINAGPFDDFLQTDAPINRGNSGGPLFNVKGEVIGINSAIFSPSGGSVGIGFAIPAALARPVIEQLKATGRVRRGWLGVRIQEVSEEIADSVGLKAALGALVLEISPGSPADKAGLKPGDVITGIGGKDVKEMRHLPRIVAESRIGSNVALTYWRQGASKTTEVTIGELDEKTEKAAAAPPSGAPKEGSPEHRLLGMQLSPLTPELRQRLKLSAAVGGLAVIEVQPGSESARRGVKPGHVIVDVNGEAVKTVADFKKALATAKNSGRKFALVRVLHGKEEAFITLPTVEEKKK